MGRAHQPEAVLEMVKRAIDLHLQEVESCLAMNGGPGLEAWRAGERPLIRRPTVGVMP